MPNAGEGANHLFEPVVQVWRGARRGKAPPVQTRVSLLLKIGAVAVAAVTVFVAVVVWFVFSLAARAATSVPTLPDSARPVGELLDGTRAVLEAAVASIEDASALGAQLGDGSRDTAAALVSAGGLIENDVADSLESVDRAMPALVEAGRVIDDTLGALTLFGVQYDPPVPFDEALADVQAGLDGLPERVRTQGSNIAALGSVVDQVALDSEEVAESLDGVAEELDAASVTLARLDASVRGVDQIGVAVGTVARYRPVVATLLVVAIVAGLALSFVLWRLGQLAPLSAALEPGR